MRLALDWTLDWIARCASRRSKLDIDAPIHSYTLEFFNTTVELGISCYTLVEWPTMINMQQQKSLSPQAIRFSL
jgi:hypothetical protein